MKLENLNLSHNHFSGTILAALTSLVSLSYIDLSYNELTGAIPSGRIFQQAPGSAFIGNPSSCGYMTGLSPCATSSKSVDHREKVLIGAIVGICCLQLLVTLTAVILALQRRNKELNEETNGLMKYEKSESIIWEREGKFTFNDIAKATNNFSEKYCIGKGGFRSVYKAELASGQIVAVKNVKVSESSDVPAVNQQSFKNEIRILTERGCIYLVYKIVERCSLAKVLYEGKGGTELDWGTRVKIVQGVAHAIAYLHHDCSPPIVHRDITLNNILLEVTDKCDVYSFGVAALEIMMGKHPGDLLSSLQRTQTSRSLEDPNLLLRDVLDPRLSLPTGQLAEEVVLIIKVALACTRMSLNSRPIMRFVAQELSTRSQSCLSGALGSITISKLSSPQKYNL
ncbi:hypothetical protein EUGRSUZ_A01349 [Eucalyptus grandis]|uniref:Uncharacterized protein n=2 Tax=Eucalyptus grandis TaxID=71139 RepID=A0ACC3M041_EUCGR|nr:hypothetical protein EUGRSUZ_A01349 [Eucalyptus grandis]